MEQYIPDQSALKVFSRSIAVEFQAVPLRINDGALRIVCAHLPSANDLSDLIFFTGMEITAEVASPEHLTSLIEQYYPDSAVAGEMTIATSQYEHRSGLSHSESAQGRNVERVDALISRAVAMKASDVHLEPTDTELSLRYRIDGVLQAVDAIAQDDQAAVVSRIKLMAGMDIAEKRRPQDGRIAMRSFNDLLDIRVSSVPTRNSEKLVLRLLNKSEKLKDLRQLGMTESTMAVVTGYLEKPQGMILVSGPTGSGKSTTLYAALSYLARPGVNIMTIEDPIEYEVAGITQSQVKPEINYDFAAALRAFLRQDPDIIMVGEIRDQETAQIALRAAMTGHMVLSSVHTNDAAATITRLIDIGIEPYLVASSLSAVIAQRLLRTYCPACQGESNRKLAVSKSERSQSATGTEAARGKSCTVCNSSGYRGRIAVFEVLEINDEVREAIQARCPAQVIEAIARKGGVHSLSEEAARLVAENRTSEAECRRVLPE